MARIAFMGAGSTVFARNILGDSMLSPALHDAEIALYDIDGTRLEESKDRARHAERQHQLGRARDHDAPGRREPQGRAARGRLRRQRHPGGRLRAGHRHRLRGARRSTACARPSPTRSASAASSAPCARSPSCSTSPATWKRSARSAWFLNYVNPMAMITGALLARHADPHRRPLPLGAVVRRRGCSSCSACCQNADDLKWTDRRHQPHGLAARDQRERQRPLPRDQARGPRSSTRRRAQAGAAKHKRHGAPGDHAALRLLRHRELGAQRRVHALLDQAHSPAS